MTRLTEAADLVATEYVASTFPDWQPFTVAIVRNAVLDCLFQSEEPDFIARAGRDPLNGRTVRAVLRRIRDDLLALCGETLERFSGAPA